MAGARTPRTSFSGEVWSDDNGTTYTFEHEGQQVWVRFYNSGELHFSEKGGKPLAVTKMDVGSGVVASGNKQNIILKPQV
jgi:hypothetical protein